MTCKRPPGEMTPVVDRTRCEAKGPCVEVCPFDVFELRTVPRDELHSLSRITRLKIWVHGGKQAYATNASKCEACGLCVEACPENAIRLRRAGPADAMAQPTTLS